MANEYINLLLDLTPILLLVLRSRHSHLYESGAMARLGLFLGFAWLVANDLDDLFGLSLIPNGSFYSWSFSRTGVFKLIVSTGLLLDLLRVYWRHIHNKRIRGIIDFIASAPHRADTKGG